MGSYENIKVLRKGKKYSLVRIFYVEHRKRIILYEIRNNKTGLPYYNKLFDRKIDAIIVFNKIKHNQ